MKVVILELVVKAIIAILLTGLMVFLLTSTEFKEKYGKENTNPNLKYIKYIFTKRMKSLWGNTLLFTAIVEAIATTINVYTNPPEIFLYFMYYYIEMVTMLLIMFMGAGLIILDISQLKEEDADSINVFIGKQLFEKGLYALVIGIFIGGLTLLVNLVEN